MANSKKAKASAPASAGAGDSASAASAAGEAAPGGADGKVDGASLAGDAGAAGDGGATGEAFDAASVGVIETAALAPPAGVIAPPPPAPAPVPSPTPEPSGSTVDAAAAAEGEAEEPSDKAPAFPRTVRVINNSTLAIKCRQSGLFVGAGGSHNVDLVDEDHARHVFGALEETLVRLGIERNLLAVVPA